ncbi:MULTISPECIES: acyl-CoA dehydrogenase family protein [unclassified Novosphingobium]|uniref:acyl-CoA dehydrogenase family protein n=1 Tax=unclassified Novosphingobium TaxID=2644732 RepID=UPI00086C068A|nr:MULTISPECIES: acyl-CoA dehydrogenase family protein [unclassified Novosphingobium]MDR6707601.1 3-hydroxy-9,10-secoandrosta-1,3,5(10)-triene-9,17-dione monooxygenase [Novosphingobium sp. 1748]ODU78042.1 MAG: flavin-dependent monooxygenase [Novosphingobium sp. SCN 63-17]OJX96237.1 MAG: flavin-dependent monooxygenase [Novosphingobium sp. 63-713]
MGASHTLAQDLVKRAADMIPVLREREAETRRNGQVSDQTIQEFVDAGFYRVLQPKAYGGYELSPKVYVDIARQLALGCMASAWVYGVVAVHNWQMALFDDRAAQDVWGADNSVRISSSYMPVGKVERVEGGYRLSGRWAFSSGSHHCDWVILGANVPREDGAPGVEPYNFLIPRADYQILKNWDVMGLQGTGSNDILVEGAFVPEHRVIREFDMFRMECPGHAVNKSALYRIPFAQVFNRTVSTTSLSTLQRALDTFIEATREKRTTYTGQRIAGDSAIQETIAEVKLTLDDLDMRLNRDLAEMVDRAERNDWPLERRAELGASTTSTVSRCVTAIDKLMLYSGGKAIYRGNLVQNAFLDIHTARAHVANNPVPYFRNLGAMSFGFPNDCLDL